MHCHLILKLEIVVICLQSALSSLSGPSFQPTSKLPSKNPSICPTPTTAVTVMPSKTLTKIPSKPSSRPSIKPTYISTLRLSSSKPSSNPLSLTKKPSSSVTTTSPSNRPLKTPSSKPTCTRSPSVIISALPTKKPTCTRSPSVIISTLPSIKPSCTRCMLSSIPSYAPSTRTTLMPSPMPTTSSPSYAPSTRPTLLPSPVPTTSSPSYAPSTRPTLLPSLMPTTSSPSYAPSTRPTLLPSSVPITLSPSYAPSTRPTFMPSPMPTTSSPSNSPSTRPTLTPSRPTTLSPSYAPSKRPSLSSTRPPSWSSYIPSKLPSTPSILRPSVNPSAKLNVCPAMLSTAKPSCTLPPTILPTWIPTLKPRCTSAPSNAPTFLKPSVTSSKISPSVKSTTAPYKIPTNLPTVIRSTSPSKKPSVSPSPASTYIPSISPTAMKSVCPSCNPSVLSTFNPSEALSVAPTEVAISKRSAVHAIVPEGYTTKDGISNEDGKLFSSVASLSLAFDVTYHGGPFMSGNVSVYNIYYGTGNSQALLDYLATHIDRSSWYSTMRHYSAGGVSISGSVFLAASIVVTKRLVKKLTDNAVVTIIIDMINAGTLPADENGIYAFIFKGNLPYNGWLTDWCGFHSAFTYNFGVYKFMVLGDTSFSNIELGTNCQGYFDGPTVNKNIGADSAASVYAHELVETISNPQGDAFYADTPEGTQENADLCTWSWGTMLPGFDNANVVIGNKSFLIQQNWLPGTGCVSGDSSSFVPTAFSTVSPSSGPSMPPVSSLKPSSIPTERPSRSRTPSKIPSIIPTSLPTLAPISTVTPTLPRPSALPTIVIPSLQCATLSSVAGCSTAASISISNSVSSISATAFSGASQLKLVYMPATVTSIQSQAFQHSSVATVYFSPSLVTIESNAFYGCKSLIAVDLSLCTSLQTLGSQAFRETGLISVVLPASLTIVSVYCFCNAVNLVTLQVLSAPSGSGRSGSSLVTIDENSFSGCSSLIAVDLSPCFSLSTIGPYAFSAAGLTSVVLPASPNLLVSSYAFYNAARLAWMKFVAPVPAGSSGNARIGSYSFAGCASLTSVSLSSVVAYVSDYAFYSLTKLISVNCSYPAPQISTNAFQHAAVTGCTGVLSPIPTSAPSIVFAPGSTRQPTSAPSSLACVTQHSPGCSTAASISISNSVSSISATAFSGASQLKLVYMPATVTSIQSQAFQHSSVATVYFSPSLVTIESNAFYGCKSLIAVDLSLCTSLQTLGSQAFRETGLISVVLPASLTIVSVYCFCNAVNLVTLQVLSAPSGSGRSGSSLVTIDENSFSGCSSLIAVDLSPCFSLSTIGPYAFSAAGLTSVVLPASPNLLVSSYAFYNAARLAWMKFVAPVPAGSSGNARIGSYSFAGCASLTSVSLSSVVAYVSDYAFYSLTKLISVNCSYPAPQISTNAFQHAAVTGCTGVLSPIPTSAPSIVAAPDSTRQPTNAPSSLACVTQHSPGCSTAVNISISNSVSSVASDAFSYASSLKFVFMPPTVTYIQTHAFRGSFVSAVYFSPGLVVIDDYAFYQCICLKSVDLSPCTSLKTLGVSAFRESGVISVILPASLNLISDSCFYSITSLVWVKFLSPSTAVRLGNTRIAANAFRGCTSLTTVTFSSAVAYIADYAFYFLASLVDVTCSYPPPQISTYAFEGSSANGCTKVILPTPSAFPTISTVLPTKTPIIPSEVPTDLPSSPSEAPTINPTETPSISSPSAKPSEEPSSFPSEIRVTSSPSESPSEAPSNPPTEAPSNSPVDAPSIHPTVFGALESNESPTVTAITSLPTPYSAFQTLYVPIYSAINTFSATTKTVPYTFTACPGMTLMIADCSSAYCVTDIHRSSDQFIRLYDSMNNMVAFNDDSCHVCSAIIYTLREPCQQYTLQQGCYKNKYCTGNFTIQAVDTPTAMPSAMPTPKYIDDDYAQPIA
eukprot:gene23744-32129_t